MAEKRKVPISRLSNVYDEFDFEMELDAAMEALEMDANFTILLFQIDREQTTTDIYNETNYNEVIFKPPVEIIATISLDEADNKSEAEGRVRRREYGNLTANILERELQNKKCDIRYGDVLAYQDIETNLKYFEVVDDGRVNSDNRHTVFGFKKYYRTVKAVTLDPDKFNGL